MLFPHSIKTQQEENNRKEWAGCGVIMYNNNNKFIMSLKIQRLLCTQWTRLKTSIGLWWSSDGTAWAEEHDTKNHHHCIHKWPCKEGLSSLLSAQSLKAKCMSTHGIMSNLHVCEGTNYTEWYIQVLDQHMLPSRQLLFRRRVLQTFYSGASQGTALLSWPDRTTGS